MASNDYGESRMDRKADRAIDKAAGADDKAAYATADALDTWDGSGDRKAERAIDKAYRADDKALNATDKAVASDVDSALEPQPTANAVGETVGGLSGAATGAALGSLGGPIGTIIGGIAGAATGWWTGRAVSEAATSFDGDEDYYRSQYATSRPADAPDLSYDTARPAYQLGYVAGQNPDYANRNFDDVEVDLRRGWDSQPGGRADWDSVRGYARDAWDRGRDQRLTLAEEQLAVGKRQVQAGEVSLRKEVDTRHVQESVPLTHEEVSIERRPLSGADASNLEIGEQSIRVPLMAEEAVVEKRVVGNEEVLVHTRPVTETKTVEGDVRKERLVTEGLDERLNP